MTTAALRAIVVDDEPLAVEGVRRLCEAHPDIEVVGEATDGIDALALIDRLHPDIVFLDIAMPGPSGLETAAALQRQSRPPRVVLVTANDNFATEAFDLAVVDYVLKPISPQRLGRAIDRVVALARAAEQTEQAAEFWLPYRGSVVRLAEAEIIRVEAERDYVRIFAADRSYLLRATLTDMANRLDRTEFVRIHRSIIMRTTRITGVRHVAAGAWVTIDQDEAEHPIGRHYLENVRERLRIV